ncbi:response regulator [Deinococcus aquatilis]|jgi:CheY-like chemotaxis protein|uniref:response regulator n=1 Tax=Deinococcus aquatilis TaxID=519440 RepID=UPI00036014CF|nr:response regulator [Deinococcus aquatilis]
MRPLQVLLVDDNPAARGLAEEAFSLSGQPCEVTMMESGDDALSALMDKNGIRPDVVLLDINMPGMDGFDVLEAMKAQPHLRPIPVVMLSGSSAPQDIRKAYTLHANAYLVKSVEFQTFLTQIEDFVVFWTQARLTTRPGESEY